MIPSWGEKNKRKTKFRYHNDTIMIVDRKGTVFPKKGIVWINTLKKRFLKKI